MTFTFLTWQLHDADLLFVQQEWTDDGDRNVRMCCEVNPEEDRASLIALDIHSPRIMVEFRDILEFRASIFGLQSGREVILSWHIVHTSPMIDHSIKKWSLRTDSLTQHHIECSGGAVFDIVGGELWIADMSKKTDPSA